MTDTIDYTATFELTDEFIDDTLVTAFEGGSNYWLERVVVVNGDYKGAEFASEVVSKGGYLTLVADEGPYDDNREFYLTRDNFREGVRKYIEANGAEYLEDVDAGIADEIVQFALFGEVVFG